MSRVLGLFCMLFAGAALAAPESSPRPPVRTGVQEAPTGDLSQRGLDRWIGSFRKRAEAAGIRPEVYEAAMKDVTFEPEVVRRDRNQAEFTKTVWDYLDTAVSDLRVSNGKAALAKHRGTLEEIERGYEVESEIVTAIWGLESAYGTFRGSDPVLSSLATLAYEGRRAAFFEGEVLAALKILQDGDTTLARLKGSWAGAMGHTQFMPSSFQKLAVDHDGDGRRNIWGEDPTDALASTAAYLKHFGWTYGQPWGVEVRLPEGFDYLMARRDLRKLPSAWAALGVQAVDGGALEDHGLASVLLPGGADGAAFLIFDNFEVLENYNTADAYVIGVGHLADRIAGGAGFLASWPRALRVLDYDERVELQRRLTAAGFDTVKIDAKMGPLTVNAIRRFQQAQGIRPDGYPSLPLLERLRALP
ncbi:MAG: lytic murein transglycosylase [Pseudomonadota bacterium]